MAGTPWRVQLLGRFELWLGERRLPDAALGSRKQRLLLKLLLLERGRSLPSERIVELLWAVPPERPGRQVATLVSRLRGVLGKEALLGGPESYRLALPSGSSVDLDEAEQLLQEAARRWALGEAALARTAAERAGRLLEQGPPLEEEPYAAWVEAVREQAARLLRLARSQLWQAAMAMGDPPAAVAAAERAIADDPLDEEAYRALMSGHAEGGAGAKALTAYRRLSRVLEEELGVEPSPETQALHDAIASGRPRTTGQGQQAGAPADRPDGGQASAHPAQPPREAIDPTFVGREEELHALAQAWAATVSGGSAAMLLAGEAGIGKSTLARRLVILARSTGGLVLESRCFDAERSLFLQPLAEALRPLVARSTPAALRAMVGDPAGLARLMPEILLAADLPEPPPLTPELAYRRAFDAVLGLLGTLASRQPVLLFVDDLHNAGATTVEFLHYLARQAPPRLLLLATVRLEEGDEVLRLLSGMTSRLEVGPLPVAAARRLAAAMGGEAIDDDLLTRTGGHPLFLVEMLRALSNQAGRQTASPIPATLSSAVLERVARAGEGVAELLSAAAVLGSRFDLASAAAVADVGIEETVRRAERAHRARLLSVAGSEFSFSNDLVHEILYQATPLPIRAARHGKAAGLFAERPELMGHHALAAGAWPQAARAYQAAARGAIAAFANRDAESLLDLALEAARRAALPESESEALLDRCLARERLARYAEAFDDAAEARAIARSIDHRALEMRALRAMGGDPSIALGRPPAACVPYLEEALAIADEIGDQPAAVDMLRRLAILETNRLRGRLARRHAEAAVRRARSVGDDLTLAAALDGRKTVAAYTGDVSTLAQVTRELRPLLERHQQLWVLQWTVFESSLVPFAAGDWPAATELVEQALALSERSGYRAYQPMFLAQRAWIELAGGAYGASLRTGRLATELAAAPSHPWWVSFACAIHGAGLVAVGAHAQAVPVLEQGLATADRDGAELHALRCLGPLAEALAGAGQTERAAALAGRVERLLPPDGGEPPFLHAAHGPLGAARAWLTMGEPRRAAELLRRLAAAAEEAGWCETLAQAALGLGRAAVGTPQQALSCLRKALALAERVGMPGVAAEANAAMATLLRQAARAEAASGAAERHEVEARRLHAQLRGTLDDSHVGVAFDRLGASWLPGGR